MEMITFQDFLNNKTTKATFLTRAITEHEMGPLCRIAKEADLYDRQLNPTINNYVKLIFTLTGTPVEDFTASNNKIASNFFHRLNTQRCNYLLGNGVTFTNKTKRIGADGVQIWFDSTKEKLGNKFDTDLKKLGYKALIHGVAFGFWNIDKLHVFPVTEFVPLWDEDTGALRAGIRYWRLAPDKPMIAVLYEEDGYTKYKSEAGLANMDFKEIESKKKYRVIVQHTDAGGDVTIGEDNYGTLPIVPLWGSALKQSTLVGMREKIDSFDLIRSGFANDLTDCSQIYWIIKNCGGMSDGDLARFRDRLKLNHIASIPNADDGAVAEPYTQEIPFQARKEYLDQIRAGIYEDFGGLDVHTVAAGATNDHIDAAYQPMDEEADEFEFQVIEFIQQILTLMNIEDMPIFSRNRISNQKEQVEMVMLEANYLDNETILRKLPNLTPDEIEAVLVRKESEEQSRVKAMPMFGEASLDTEDASDEEDDEEGADEE